MKLLASTVAGIIVHGPDSPEFDSALPGIVGAAPRDLLKPALPYSVIVENRGARTISFLGVRFDMLAPNRKQYSVVHYADSLRNPRKSDLRPGTKRFVCAEPEYTALVLRRDVAPRTRGRMNLNNLRRMLDIRASLDCVAFDDGEFTGPDSQGAYERLSHERRVELEFASAVVGFSGPSAALEKMLYDAVEDPGERARRTLSRKLLEAMRAGGPSEAMVRAQAHRCRIPLWRSVPPPA